MNYIDEDIRWLQISDMHIGNTKYKWTDHTLKSRFEYLLKERISKINYVIITGDLIDKGCLNDKKCVDILNDFLTILSQHCDKVIITLGNHDYVRNKPRYSLLQSWKKTNNKEVEGGDYSNKLVADFEKIHQLINAINHNGNIECDNTSKVYAFTDINIVSINTSIFSGQPKLDKEGNIIYGAGNVPKIEDDGYLWICEDELPSFSNKNKTVPTIMIGHHPIEMFERASQDRIARFAEECGILNYYCGHMHSYSSDRIGKLRQITSAGLFRNDYTVPSFSIYTMKKSRNESVESESYYWDGEWKPCKPNDWHTEKEGKRKKSDRDGRSHEAFVVKPSESSGGAIRTPYGDGFFNIYVSKDNLGAITIPHRHENQEEITYVTKGSVLSFIGNELKVIREGGYVNMPKDQFHGFLPLSYPCEYITMSVEDDNYSYSYDWRNEIKRLDGVDDNLKTGEVGLDSYKIIIEDLKSSIMEVRWHAKEILNKRLVKEDNEDNAYIRDAVGALIRPAIRSMKVEDLFFGISIAYELGIDISDKEIKNILDNNNYMVVWVCFYYIVKLKRNFNIKKVFARTISSDLEDDTKYYKSSILLILILMVDHDGELLNNHLDYLKMLQEKNGTVPFDEILIYFVMWYTSFTFPEEELDYAKARERFDEIFDIDGETILRGFTNVQDHFERYKQISNSKTQGKLIEASCAFFESRRTVEKMNDNREDMSTKERIENYLRIIVSEKCNLSCVYCHHEGRIDSLIGKEINVNTNFNLRELLNKAKELGFKKIKISGGEPLLYPNVISICNTFQNDFDDIGFTTNGTQIEILRDELTSILPSKISFNVTLNSMDKEKNRMITGMDQLKSTLSGIEFLIENGYKTKINSVITSYNFDDITELISFAARSRVDIKLLDLFAVDETPSDFKHVSIAEIKNEVKKIFHLQDKDFVRIDDYLVANVMGIKVLIPSRIYSIDCQHNCQMYPCAEGIFGIRIYEDYSCAKCFKGTLYRGGLEKLDINISQIREELNTMRLSY